jgi:hypothetical protein
LDLEPSTNAADGRKKREINPLHRRKVVSLAEGEAVAPMVWRDRDMSMKPTGGNNRSRARIAKLIQQVLGAVSEFEKATVVSKLKGAGDRKRATALPRPCALQGGLRSREQIGFPIGSSLFV